MSDKEIKIGDSVLIRAVGIDGLYTVDGITNGLYSVSQGYSDISSRGHKTKSSYRHRMTVPLEKLRKP